MYIVNWGAEADSTVTVLLTKIWCHAFKVLFLLTGPEAGVRAMTQVFTEHNDLPLHNGHSRH